MEQATDDNLSFNGITMCFALKLLGFNFKLDRCEKELPNSTSKSIYVPLHGIVACVTYSNHHNFNSTWHNFVLTRAFVFSARRQAAKFADALGVGRWFLLAGATSLRYMSFNLATTPAAWSPAVGSGTGWPSDGMMPEGMLG